MRVCVRDVCATSTLYCITNNQHNVYDCLSSYSSCFVTLYYKKPVFIMSSYPCSYVCATSPVHQHNVYDCLSSYTVSSRCITGPCSSCPHTCVRHVLSLKKMSSFRRALALKNLFIHMKKNNWPGWRGCKPRRKFLLFLMTSRCS